MFVKVMLLLVGFVFSTLPLTTSGKHIAVLGGIMKSHHLTVVPLIERLVERGHQVSFLLPNTTEHKSFFPSGVSSAKMVYLGTKDWSFDTLFSGAEYDIKNLPWYKKLIAFAKILWSYRESMEAPFFSMTDHLVKWLQTVDLDAIVLHVASFGNAHVVRDSGIPFVSYFSVPPLPMFLVHDKDKVCRYPNMLYPPALAKLKTSLVARVKNHMMCRFLQGYMLIANHELNAIFQARGVNLNGTFLESLTDTPQLMLLGGPPLSLNVKLPPQTHVLGIVNKHVPRPIPAELLGWLDAASEANARVVYISMGTKYELHQRTCAKLVSLLKMMVRYFSLRILWSLRASQQELLWPILPKQGKNIRIEFFTPQPEVLQHPSVQVFLSHCGWGGVSDAISAGVPVLGYPGMSDQFSNARMLEEAGAGIVVANDFSNLIDSLKIVLANNSFAAASRAAGDTLKSYGGLPRAIEIIEAAAVGEYLKPDPEILAKMSETDPFFDESQWFTQLLSFVGFVSLPVLGMLLCYHLCRYYCCCCCRRNDETLDQEKKDQ